MGAAVEGWSPERIKDTYGYVDRFYPYKHYANRVDWNRLPGTTEDGIERQKLMCRAIIDKQDRITVQDLVAAWNKYLDPAKIIYHSEPMEAVLLGYIRAGVPAPEIGRLNDWHSTNSMVRSGQAIGLINAGDPEGAARDVADVGTLLYAPTDVAIAWAKVTAAAIAEACRPGATVESVVETGRSFASDRMRAEIDRGLEIASKFEDYEAMRAEFYKHYNGIGTYYAAASANETVTKALALFAYTKADPKQAILCAVNFGRDTDCLAATAGGLSGALSGPAAIPPEWIEQLDSATTENPYTNTVCTIREHADGIYSALKNRARKMREQIAVLEG
jgi:ADP-ribosylglycohydrolase